MANDAHGLFASIDATRAAHHNWEWRNRMHPDDRAWLDTVETPLRVHGWVPPRWTRPPEDDDR